MEQRDAILTEYDYECYYMCPSKTKTIQICKRIWKGRQISLKFRFQLNIDILMGTFSYNFKYYKRNGYLLPSKQFMKL